MICYLLLERHLTTASVNKNKYKMHEYGSAVETLMI